jgi:hypothetical protein
MFQPKKISFHRKILFSIEIFDSVAKDTEIAKKFKRLLKHTDMTILWTCWKALEEHFDFMMVRTISFSIQPFSPKNIFLLIFLKK